jgi:hypothetical protein
MNRYSSEDRRRFFAWSDVLVYMVLRPLSHIAPNWDVGSDQERYRPEPGSFAEDLNRVIDLVAECPRPARYHDHEDLLAECTLRDLKWPIQKKGSRWIGSDYVSIIEQGAFDDLDQRNLIAAAAGRVHAALDHGQKHFEKMEEGHRYILAGLLSVIIYHRYCVGESFLAAEED